MASEILDYNSKKILDTLRNTVARDTTDEEFLMFVEFCRSTGFNPLKKEVWAIVIPEKKWVDDYGKQKSRPRQFQLMTGINGYFAAANKHEQFDGYETGLISPTGELAPQSYFKNDFLGAWCRVYRKDRKVPTLACAFMAEYEQQSPLWKTKRRTMIQKVAESVAFRKTFPNELGGTYTQEEMPEQFSTKENAVEVEHTGQAQIEAPKANVEARAAIEVQPTPAKSPTLAGARAAASSGRNWVYDRTKVRALIPDKDELARLWNVAKAECDPVAVGDEIFAHKEIVGLEQALIKRPEPKVESTPIPFDDDITLASSR